MTFHLTGDLEAANALDGYADALGQRARGEQPSAPKKPLFAVDPEYR